MHTHIHIHIHVHIHRYLYAYMHSFACVCGSDWYIQLHSYSSQKSPTSKEPYILSKKPCILSKEPILSKGPCILWKKHYIHYIDNSIRLWCMYIIYTTVMMYVHRIYNSYDVCTLHMQLIMYVMMYVHYIDNSMRLRCMPFFANA